MVNFIAGGVILRNAKYVTLDAERSAQVIAGDIPSMRQLNLSPATTVGRATALQLSDYADWATQQPMIIDPEIGDAG